jgi:hypothetical protein
LARSTNGPDWVDVCFFLLALDTVHACKTVVTISTPGLLANETALVTLLSVWDTLPGSQEPMMVTTERKLISRELQELPAIVYNGLYAHDHSISEKYKQRKLENP